MHLLELLDAVQSHLIQFALDTKTYSLLHDGHIPLSEQRDGVVIDLEGDTITKRTIPTGS